MTDMPELPEVEVTRLSFAEAIEGATITGVRLGKPLRWPLGIAPEKLRRARVGAAARRGKYLWLPVAGEHLRGGLLLHLGMSGSLAFSAQAGVPGAHDHFDLQTDRGLLRLTDPRRFGAVVWSEGLDVEPAAKLLAGLGLEPFDPRFDGEHLHAGLSGRRVAIKLAAEKLATAVRQVLRQALDAGGTTLRDFKDAHGVAGSFQMQADVYGREGEPCRVCGTRIRRIVQGQRSTFHCPKCQKR